MFYDNFVNLCSSINKAPSAVAVEMGFQKSVVTRWKKNGSTPTDANLAKIADYFGVDVGSLTETLWSCKDCEFTYSPAYLADVKAHKERHDKWALAKNKFHFWGFNEREQRYDLELIEKDVNNPFRKRLDAAKGIIFAYYSRSIVQHEFDLNHISFEEYIPYYLHSQKHRFTADIYDLLVGSYGTKPGMSGTIWNNFAPETVAKTQKAIEASARHKAEKEKPATIGDELVDMTLVKFPVIGTIAAGYNCCALEEYTGDFAYFSADDLSAPPEEYFVLRIKGNSMYPKLLENDCVLVRRKPCVDNGKIAVVIYDGEDATAKIINYNHDENWLELVPINPEYLTRRIEGAELEQCCILGEVVKLQRDL